MDGQDIPIKLQQGRFKLRRDCVETGREHLLHWDSQHGKAWLSQKAKAYCNRMEVQPAGVKVRDLGYRWGSCGKGAWLYFHWKVMPLPPRIAEYVVAHELAHLHGPHHTPQFWKRVERAMPDHQQRKNWLAEQGMVVEGI